MTSDSESVKHLGTDELVKLAHPILMELASRGAIKVTHRLAAEYSEWLAHAFLTRRDPAVAREPSGPDFRTSDGLTYEVKSYLHLESTRSPTVSGRIIDFDFLIAIVLTANLEIEAGLLVPREAVERLSKVHSNGWTLRVTSAVRVNAAVDDIGMELRDLGHAAAGED